MTGGGPVGVLAPMLTGARSPKPLAGIPDLR
jgi:hypothetical protein